MFSEVVSLSLAQWPDLRRPGSEIFTQCPEKMHDKVCQKRRRSAPPFLRYSRKTSGGASKRPPPGGARVNTTVLHMNFGFAWFSSMFCYSYFSWYYPTLPYLCGDQDWKGHFDWGSLSHWACQGTGWAGLLGICIQKVWVGCRFLGNVSREYWIWVCIVLLFSFAGIASRRDKRDKRQEKMNESVRWETGDNIC